MSQAFIQLGLFTAKTFILFLLLFLVFAAFFTLLAKSKDKTKGRLTIKNLNKYYDETKDIFLSETVSKKDFKTFLKEKKKQAKQASKEKSKHVYVLNFHGDLKASAVASLREEITAILNIATREDEVIVRLESAGGVVHGYGLAAAQLMRLRSYHIPLTITVDKLAASGGYMMACIANKILAAPFAIIGSIGVIIQLPNFHRYLKDKRIDFEQLMAGDFKRTITLFGENTEEGREKLQHEIEDVHQQFKELITQHRPQIDIKKVATGEHWLGQQALALNLVDDLKTSDDYLLECSKKAKLFEITYEIKKPLLSRLSASASQALLNLLMRHSP